MSENLMNGIFKKFSVIDEKRIIVFVSILNATRFQNWFINCFITQFDMYLKTIK